MGLLPSTDTPLSLTPNSCSSSYSKSHLEYIFEFLFSSFCFVWFLVSVIFLLVVSFQLYVGCTFQVGHYFYPAFSLGGLWAYPLTYILTSVLQIQPAKGPVRSFTPQLLIHPRLPTHFFHCHWLGSSAPYPSEQSLLFTLCPFVFPCQPLTTFFSHQGWLHLSLPKILQLQFLVKKMLFKF